MNRRSLLTWAAVLSAVILVLLASMVKGSSTTTGSAAASSAATVAQPEIISQTSTGSVQPQTNAASYPISAEQAGSLTRAAAPGATLAGAPTLVSFQGVVAYEVPLDAGMAYIDATSGQVLSAPAIAAGATTGSSATTTSGATGATSEDSEDREHSESHEGGELREGGAGREHH